MAILSGFNPDEVNASIDAEKQACSQLVTALSNDMQTMFVNKMAEVWACVHAQKFFEQFKSMVEDFIRSGNSVFETVITTMGQAGTSWASQTQTAGYSAPQFERNDATVSIDSIQENINGVRGLDVENGVNIANSSLSSVKTRVSDALTSAVRGVDTCGFVGGQQAENLKNSLRTVTDSIMKGFEDIETLLNDAIKATVGDYGDTRGQVQEHFIAQA